MTRTKSKTLTPKRRFPEFRDAPGWDSEPFERLYDFKPTNSLSRDQLNYEGGEVKNIHYGDIHTKFSALFDVACESVPFINTSVDLSKVNPEAYCRERDLVFADASEDLDDVGKSIELIDLRDAKVLSGTHTILARPKSPVPILGFGGYLFKSEQIRTQIRKEGQGAKVAGISPTRLATIDVSFPHDEAEQRKIADCLGSLDDLIAAADRKLAALRDHKRGLMQQLFPQPGQSQPQLRFPEFRDAGDWEETTIGEIGSFYYGKSAPKWSLEDDAPTRCVRYGELYTKFGPVITETYSRTNIDPNKLRFSKGGEILVPRVGEKPEGFGQCCSYLPLKGIAIGEMISVFETKQNALFYTYYFRNMYRQFASVVEGQNVKNLYYAELEPLSICRPSLEEQQKIAACLTALDTQITAQAAQLDTLHQHKRGLMQQLFPSSDTGSM